MRKRLALAVLAAGAALLSGEAFIRCWVRAWPVEKALYRPPYLTERDGNLRWRFPASAGRNALGLRNREVGAKPPATTRILFLGDSLTFSGDTTTDELYTAAIERRLNELPPSDTRFEVINAGVPGYTTYQELEFLKIYGIDMAPDVVVLGFVLNDVFDDYLHRPTTDALLDGEPTVHLHQFDTDALPGSLFARSYLAHELVRRSELLWKRLTGRPVYSFERRGDFYLAWKPHGWRRVRERIGEMKALLSAKGIALDVVVFPVVEQVDRRSGERDREILLYPQARISGICEEHGIPMLDLTEAITRRGGAALFADYLHLNHKGNDVVAEEVERFLRDRLEAGSH